MVQTVQFLIGNPDVLEKVKNGTASLLGVSKIELSAILEILDGTKPPSMEYWV